MQCTITMASLTVRRLVSTLHKSSTVGRFVQGIRHETTLSTTTTTTTTQTPLPDVGKKPSQDSSNAPSETFASLMRNCKFTQMGNPVGKVVIGRIYHIVNDDIYIDFGGKFPCVCNRPSIMRSKFVRGTKVKVLINSLEESKTFLGYNKEITLLEADCTFLGLHAKEEEKKTAEDVVNDEADQANKVQ